MPDLDKKEFTFIKEQIKKKPFYKKKWFVQGTAGFGLAVAIGIVAGVTFAVVRPWAEGKFGKNNNQQPVIIQDEVLETERMKETQPERHTETEQKETQPPQTTIIEEKQLDIEDYATLFYNLRQIAKEASNSLVTVLSESNGMNWSDELGGIRTEVSGLIIASNNSGIYILTEVRALEDRDHVLVTFSDGTSAEGTVQKKDDITEIAVIRISWSLVGEETREQIVKADLGASAQLRAGEPIIYVGNHGESGETIAYGMITSASKKPVIDNSYQVFETDIVGGNEGSGILLNLRGKVIGIVSQNFFYGNSSQSITALGISDIKYLMEALSNNADISYMGVTGVEVHPNEAKEYQIPLGIYVKDVAADSPAMHAGIQRGIDIITGIQGKEISTIEEYVAELRAYKPDEVIEIELKRRGIEGYVDVKVPLTIQGK